MGDMTEFDIKKGFCKNVDGDGLRIIMKAVFGSASVEGDLCVSSYGAIARIEAKLISKTLLGVRTVNIEDISGLSGEQILESKRKLNEFLLRTTGFTPKNRLKRAKDKAKKGEL